MKFHAIAIGLFIASGAASATTIPDTVNLQAVDRIGAQIWISGTQGSLFYSTDNGQHWRQLNTPEGTAELQFRDVQALGDGKLVLMSAGEGSDSRVYYSPDNGKSWTLSLQGNEHSFFDCIDFADRHEGWLYGDSEQGKLTVYRSEDSGQQWQQVTLPFDALPEEGGFASSGSCITVSPVKDIVIGTGNAEKSRLIMRYEGAWRAFETPLQGGSAAGVFSVLTIPHGVFALGGSLQPADKDKPAQAAVFDFRKLRWNPLPELPLKGAIYGHGESDDYLYVSNPDGIARFNGGGWEKISDNNTWAMACDEVNGCIGVGAKGSVTLIPPAINEVRE